ncbi:MAG: helix-turn-helix transcriptional regulator [Candidatus Aminicenantes bacterium]|nr:helix-turn-helix transcriptional regulator [Candidatus Aminicenantes bacterium]
MKQRTKKIVVEAGQRLEAVRKSYDHSRQEMASRLGVSRSNLYKNEIGFYFPRLDTLVRLHDDFDISLDWLLFDIGPMHTKDKQAAIAMAKQSKGMVNESPDVIELLTAIEQDQVLRHELLAYFYKYKKNMVKNE